MSRGAFFRTSTCLSLFCLLASAIQAQSPAEPCQPALNSPPKSRIGLSLVSGRQDITIEELTFTGQTELAPEELKAVAKSVTDHRYADNPQWLDEVRQRVLEQWQHYGYFRAQVRGTALEERPGDAKGRRVTLTVSMDVGRRYYLKEITFQGNTQFGSAELRDMFPVHDLEIFDTHQFQKGLETLRKAYGARGFINSSAVPTFDVDEKNALIRLNLEVQEGALYRFGDISVVGLTPTLVEKLLQDSELQRGTVFNTDNLERFFDRNRAVLPKDADSAKNVSRSLNEEKHTVDIVMDFRTCPETANR